MNEAFRAKLRRILDRLVGLPTANPEPDGRHVKPGDPRFAQVAKAALVALYQADQRMSLDPTLKLDRRAVATEAARAMDDRLRAEDLAGGPGGGS